MRTRVDLTLRPPVHASAAGLQAQFGDELGRLHAMVENLSRHGHIDHLLPDLPAALVPTYSQLIEADVPEVLCRRLRASSFPTSSSPRSSIIPTRFARLCARRSSSASRSRRRSGRWRASRRIVALVGPTGVGKTTTVAKLAANLKLTQGGSGRADHGRYVPDRGGRAAQDLRRDHRPTAGRGE